MLIWLLDLVSFCYYTVEDENCIQTDVKLLATHAIDGNCIQTGVKLLATHAINCLNVQTFSKPRKA